MTVSSTETKTIYGGNGSTAVFAIPFMFMQDEDVEVSRLNGDGVEFPQTLGTDYQLSGSGDQAGGTCSMAVTPLVGETLVIRRNPAIVQEVDYLENDAFPAATHEAALDKLTMICQALSERLDRTITFRVSSAVAGVNLPEPDGDRVLAWNEVGDNLVNKDIVSAGAITVPVPVSQGGTGANNVTEALFNLGFGAAGAAVAGCESGDEVVATIDPDILRADRSVQLAALFTDTVQPHVGTSLAGFIPTSNKIEWSLTAASTFDELSSVTPVSLVFHIAPGGNSLSFASAYTLYGEEYDASAVEVRLVVDINGGKKRITIANARAAA